MRGYSNLVTSYRDADPSDWINAITTGGGVFIEDFAGTRRHLKTIKARASEHLSGSSDRSSFGRVFMAIGRPASPGWPGHGYF